MIDAIQIDAATGEVSLSGFRVTPHTSTGTLPAGFVVGPERPVEVAGAIVPCRFATAAMLDGSTAVTVSLRFEAGALVGLCFALAQPVSYDDINAVERRHRRWIAGKLGQDPGGMTVYPWGSAGVAQDKSGGVHVFLHNRNNTWAR